MKYLFERDGLDHWLHCEVDADMHYYDGEWSLSGFNVNDIAIYRDDNDTDRPDKICVSMGDLEEWMGKEEWKRFKEDAKDYLFDVAVKDFVNFKEEYEEA